MTLSDNSIAAKNLGDFFKSRGKKGPNISKKMHKNVLRKPGRSLESEQTLVLHLHLEAQKEL